MHKNNQKIAVIYEETVKNRPLPGHLSANSPVLQSARRPRAVDSGEAKMRTASWENVDKQMPRNTK